MNNAKVSFSNWDTLEYTRREQLNTLHTNLMLSGKDIQVIGITSSDQNEGKSFVSMELMRTMAVAGRKVVLVDADIRKSNIIRHYGVRIKDKVIMGLSNYLCGQADIDSIIRHTDIENADIIFAGNSAPNPNNLLDSEDFSQLIKRLRNQYDIIIIDCPPIGLVIDGTIIAKRCDGMVFVVRAGNTSHRAAIAAKEQLEVSGVQILGTVLNRLPHNGKGYYNHKYYGLRYGHKKYAKYGDYAYYAQYGEKNEQK